MLDYWLKAIGTGSRRHDDKWVLWEDGLLERTVTFPPRRPGVKRGDRIVYYAVGWGLVFAEGEAIGSPYPEAFSDVNREWPWRVDIRLEPDRRCKFIHEGIPLDSLSVDGRDLRGLMRRRSHIRLTRAEYEAAVRALSGSTNT